MQPERSCPQCSYRTTLTVADRCPVCNVPLVLQERTWTPTRRAARTKLPPGFTGKLDDRLDVTVLDLSILGARLEHRAALRSGWRYVLSVPLKKDALPLQLLARVVWTRVQRAQRVWDQAGMVYESGVEFLELSAEREQELSAFLGGAGAVCPGPLPAKVAPPRD